MPPPFSGTWRSGRATARHGFRPAPDVDDRPCPQCAAIRRYWIAASPEFDVNGGTRASPAAEKGARMTLVVANGGAALVSHATHR